MAGKGSRQCPRDPSSPILQLHLNDSKWSVLGEQPDEFVEKLISYSPQNLKGNEDLSVRERKPT